MIIVKNLKENHAGNLQCQALINDVWKDLVINPECEYIVDKSSEWPDIKRCPQEEKDAHEQTLINQQSIEYLDSTDWYVMRAMDSGEPIPDDVKKKRAEARAAIK